MRHSVFSPVVLTTALLLWPASGSAQQEPETGPAGQRVSPRSQAIEEITVTARKREENLQEVPISITAFGAAELEARSIRDLGGLDHSTPNLKIRHAANSRNSVIVEIRGIRQGNYTTTIDPRVAIYLDGVYLARAQGGVFDILDLERIEVLRGPQGTLFGKNTVAGLINVVTKKPEPDFSALARIGFGNYHQFSTGGMINVPIIDDVLFARASFVTNEAEGYQKNQFQGSEDWNNDRNQSLRASLRYLPIEDVEVLVTGEYERARERNNLASCEFHNPTAGFIGLGRVLEANFGLPAGYVDGVIEACNSTQRSSKFKSADEYPDDNFLDLKAITGTVSWDLGPVELTSVSAWRNTRWKSGFGDGISLAYLSLNQADRSWHHQWSQELRLTGSSFDDRLDWTAGLYGFREKGKEDFTVFVYTCPPAFPNPFLCRDQEFNTRNHSWAAFTEATYHLTDRLALTAGVRRTQERKQFKRHQRSLAGAYDSSCGGAIVAPGERDPRNPPFCKVNERFDAWTPRVNLTYQIADNLMLYAGWSRGFASGGFNTNFTQAQYEPEFAEVWEAGFKSSWLDERVIVNLSAFHSDYDDIQLSTGRLINNTLVALVLNAAEADIDGVELEVVARPLAGLTLRGGLGVTEADYKNFFDPGAQVDRSDAEFPGVAPWQVNLSAAYSFQVGSLGELTLRSDWQHRAKTHYSLEKDCPCDQDKVGLLNSRATFRLPDGKTDIAIWATNLLDREWLLVASDLRDSLGYSTEVYAPPRRYGISITRRFGE